MVVVKTACAMPNKFEPRHILDVTSLKEGREPAEVADHRPQCSRATQDEALAYFVSSRVLFHEPRALHLTFDGVRAASDENVIFVAWLPQADVAAIPPFQAGRGQRVDSETFVVGRHETVGSIVRPRHESMGSDK